MKEGQRKSEQYIMKPKDVFTIAKVVLVVFAAVGIAVAGQHGQGGSKDKSLKPPENLRIIVGPKTAGTPPVRMKTREQSPQKNKEKQKAPHVRGQRDQQKEKDNPNKDRQRPDQPNGSARQGGN